TAAAWTLMHSTGDVSAIPVRQHLHSAGSTAIPGLHRRTQRFGEFRLIRQHSRGRLGGSGAVQA
ncbi:hypothetical protein, partial [Mycobacteroides chelonae]